MLFLDAIKCQVLPNKDNHFKALRCDINSSTVWAHVCACFSNACHSVRMSNAKKKSPQLQPQQQHWRPRYCLAMDFCFSFLLLMLLLLLCNFSCVCICIGCSLTYFLGSRSDASFNFCHFTWQFSECLLGLGQALARQHVDYIVSSFTNALQIINVATINSHTVATGQDCSFYWISWDSGTIHNTMQIEHTTFA